MEKTNGRALLSRILTLVTILVPLTGYSASGEAGSFLEDPSVRQYIDQVSRDHGLEKTAMQALFQENSPRQSVIDRISRPAERTLKWYEYRRIFMSSERIEGGAQFAKRHAALLLEAQQTYGVPWQIITAIIGVETYYGRYTGKDEAFPALATLAFNYPRRSTFFKNELTEFLLLTAEEQMDPRTIKGSYAGAMGLPQFISSSYRRYAVDFDGDGRRDLWSSDADVIGSVGNYFKQHGWRQGEPIAERLYPDTVAYRSLVSKKRKPGVSKEQLNEVGLKPRLRSKGKMSLMEFQQKDIRELWLGHFNFYVITQYNHSRLYARAVLELAAAIKKETGAIE